MKKILLLLGFTISLQIFSQTTEEFSAFIKTRVFSESNAQKASSAFNLKDSTYQWHWYNATSTWTLSIKVTYSYNTTYNETATLSSYYNQGGWHPNMQTINYVYDSNNHLLSKTEQHWIPSGWENYSRITCTYDASGNQLSEVQEDWDNVSSSWINNTYLSYTYNALNKPITFLAQSWDTSLLNWTNGNRATLNYNTNNEYINILIEQWDANLSVWITQSQTINYVYTNGDLISLEEQVWDQINSIFKPSYTQRNTYDANHHILTTTYQDWSTSTNMYYDSAIDTLTYDVNGNQITYVNHQWNTQSNSWRKANRIYDYYSSSVGIIENGLQSAVVSLHPNPTTNDVVISINNQLFFNEVSVADITGKTVLLEKTNLTSSLKLNLSHLNSGIYFISIKSDGFTYCKKFIKE